MAVAMNIFGLLPVMMASGIGADVVKRISSPMLGGLVSLLVLTLIVIPLAYHGWSKRQIAQVSE
jgi:Cu(I)/Ag(I) efflux system membrane protein CusA/SilA